MSGQRERKREREHMEKVTHRIEKIERDKWLLLLLLLLGEKRDLLRGDSQWKRKERRRTTDEQDERWTPSLSRKWAWTRALNEWARQSERTAGKGGEEEDEEKNVFTSLLMQLMWMEVMLARERDAKKQAGRGSNEENVTLKQNLSSRFYSEGRNVHSQ